MNILLSSAAAGRGLRPAFVAVLLGFTLNAGLSQGSDSRADPTPSFAGLWKTTYGAMRLRVDGRRVSGFYAYGGVSRIEGTVEGRKLTFQYREAAVNGEGWFELSEDGSTFDGDWTAVASRPTMVRTTEHKRWTGQRVKATADRIWLVVLEAYWEAGLDEPEYSYGAMLREFFRRAPQVQVRHRFFHDEDDLRQLCAELRFLPEPVVLYISTHGSAEGLSVGGKTVSAAGIADALNDTGDIRLLHFGSCSVMSGKMPALILQRLGSQALFPISGYRNAADWAGSAVIDFLYLSLVLERKLPPAEAVDHVRSTISFSHATTSRPQPIAPAGLCIVVP